MGVISSSIWNAVIGKPTQNYNAYVLDIENYDNDSDLHNQILDPISLEPIPQRYLIKIQRDNYYFAYNVLTLYQWINSTPEPVLPHTNTPITEYEKDKIFRKMLSLNPLVYYIYVYDKFRKEQRMIQHVFTQKEDASIWISDNKETYPNGTLFTIFSARLPKDIEAYNLIMRYGHQNGFETNTIDIEK